MSRLKTSSGFAGAAFILVFASASANAQATRTWVSGVGDDANPCSRTAPCKTFAGAISKTAEDGEISVLDPGGFGAVTITKSITINGTPGAGYGSILVPRCVHGRDHQHHRSGRCSAHRAAQLARHQRGRHRG